MNLLSNWQLANYNLEAIFKLIRSNGLTLWQAVHINKQTKRVGPLILVLILN